MLLAAPTNTFKLNSVLPVIAPNSVGRAHVIVGR